MLKFKQIPLLQAIAYAYIGAAAQALMYFWHGPPLLPIPPIYIAIAIILFAIDFYRQTKRNG